MKNQFFFVPRWPNVNNDDVIEYKKKWSSIDSCHVVHLYLAQKKCFDIEQTANKIESILGLIISILRNNNHAHHMC